MIEKYDLSISIDDREHDFKSEHRRVLKKKRIN